MIGTVTKPRLWFPVDSMVNVVGGSREGFIFKRETWSTKVWEPLGSGIRTNELNGDENVLMDYEILKQITLFLVI